ncbi:MAG: hypothetical protein HY763_10590 [Planctomycetes bacterium]|nr:hypothetical protein [Planctomycetota bacterium]
MRFHWPAAFGMALSLGTPAWAAPQPAIRFVTPADIAARPAAPYPAAVETRAVDLDLTALAAAEPDSVLELAMEPGVVYGGVVDTVEQRSGTQFSLRGHLEDDPDGYFFLVVHEDVAVGMMMSVADGASYRINYSGAGFHTISRIDPSRYGECGIGRAAGAGVVPGGVALHADSGDPAEAQADVDAEDEPAPDAVFAPDSCVSPYIAYDAIIVYSDNSRVAAGGTSAIRAEVQMAVDVANQAYDNSNISIRVRLVYTAEVNYDESGTYDDHLDRLTDSGDGILDSLHSTRNSYGADTVSLLVDDTDPQPDGTSTAGLAWCSVNSGSAFSIVNWSAAAGNFSYPHEVGHNQGCDHDRDNGAVGCGEYSYSFGHRFTGDSFQLWRTVMAYRPGTRIPYFSNPNVSFDGEPTGVPAGQSDSAYNAATINNTDSTFQNYRVPRFDVWVQAGYGGTPLGTYQNPQPTIPTALAQLYSGGSPQTERTIWLKPGTHHPSGITLSSPAVFRACGGTAAIGQ